MRALFEGIYSTATNKYLEAAEQTAEDIENMDDIIGVIHCLSDDRELTFQCFGEGPMGIFPARWSKDWESLDLTDSEIVEDLINSYTGQDYIVDTDYWTNCNYGVREFPAAADAGGRPRLAGA